MKFSPNAFHKLFCSPLMLHAPVREAFERVLLARMGLRAGIDDEEIVQCRDTDESIMQRFHNVAVIRVHGVIDKMMTSFEKACYGGCDLDDVDAALVEVQSNPRIDTVVLDIHSPGGSVTGVPETADRIRKLRNTKEVHAFTSTICASGAYYLASQADQITATPSACIGSIGVYIALLDETKAMEMKGYKVNLIKAGKYKAMGAAFKELTDDERELFQSRVDRIYSDFKRACTELRPIDDETMQGQTFDGDEAKARFLVDQVTTATLDEYVSSLIQ